MTSYTHPLINQPLKGKYKAFYLYVILIGCIWNFSARFAQIWLMIRTQICTSLYCMDLDNFCFCIMHPFVIISYIIVFDVQCIHICLLRVLDWWIYIFQILENFSISIERFPSLCNSNLQIPNEKIVHVLLYRILELWNITLHKGWLGTCIGEQPKLLGGGYIFTMIHITWLTANNQRC